MSEMFCGLELSFIIRKDRTYPPDPSVVSSTGSTWKQIETVTCPPGCCLQELTALWWKSHPQKRLNPVTVEAALKGCHWSTGIWCWPRALSRFHLTKWWVCFPGTFLWFLVVMKCCVPLQWELQLLVLYCNWKTIYSKKSVWLFTSRDTKFHL